MPIVSISVQNYKSLRSVTIAPKPLSVLVGANASGKTNFADCLDFISEVYRHGLEVAVTRKGGYENIAFRRQQRSKLPIRIELVVELSSHDVVALMKLTGYARKRELELLPRLRVEHSFEFVANTTAIRAQFKISQENLAVSEWVHETWHTLVTMHRKNDEISVKPIKKPATKGPDMHFTSLEGLFHDFSSLRFYAEEWAKPSATELIAVTAGRAVIGLQPFVRVAQSIKVFQVSPVKSREEGVPIPNPILERSGANLPAVIDDIQKNNPDAWSSVMEVMRAILPGLRNIEVSYTSSKRLGLFFREEGYRRPWAVEEVSDGTIQTLALLAAIFDPESTALVLEEIENSVHPWIMRRILDACREASASKQIILTTHSPIVINAVAPEEVWVIWRENGESHLELLPNLNEELLGMWAKGQISTFDYLDSGALPLAIPPAPSDDPALQTVG